MKQTIKLNESQLKNIIRETLLKETSRMDLERIYGGDPDDYGADKSILSMDDDYYHNGELPYEDEISKEANNILYSKFCNMVSRMRSSDQWETLEKLVHSNPIYKKWYEKMVKDVQNTASWNAFDSSKKGQLRDFKNSVDYFASKDANLNVYDKPYYDGEAHIDWVGHENPKITESQLRNIIKESIKKILNEGEGAEDALAWDLRRQEEEYEAKKVYEKDITISSRLIKRAIKSFFLKPKRFKKEYVRQFFSNNGINPDDIVRVSNYLYNILSQSFNAREYPAKIKRVTYGGNSIPVLSVDILQAARNLCNQYPELFKQEIVSHVIARAIIHDKTYERYTGSYETYYD